MGCHEQVDRGFIGLRFAEILQFDRERIWINQLRRVFFPRAVVDEFPFSMGAEPGTFPVPFNSIPALFLPAPVFVLDVFFGHLFEDQSGQQMIDLR